MCGELPLLQTSLHAQIARYIPTFASFCLIVVRALGSVEKGRTMTSLLVVIVVLGPGDNSTPS